MKTVGFAALLCLAAVADGFAADMPMPTPPVPPDRYAPIQNYDWGGFYVGINGGYGFGHSNWSNTSLPFETGSFGGNGALAGATLGINYQAGQFVFGFEADADWTGFKGTSAVAYCSLVTAGAVCETQERWLATFRARIGYAVDRFLIFGTAGGATGSIWGGLTPPGTFDISNNFGWTAGGGIETSIVQNWTAKIEYLYVNLGSGVCPTNCGLAVPISIPFNENLVRVGVNYRFAF
jgi:outer membrane immunogenic protein